MHTFPYIAIEGAIGVGKTTLARVFGEAFPAEILLEVFEENPFLSDFYADRDRYAFQTQIFFLLSRYRQQHDVIARALRVGPLVSDYLFAKDWLFAHLNLAGDELAMYQRVHAILGEQIPGPNLVVYLRAATDTLMHRILLRDRAYERNMSRQYIDDLRQAYEGFFANYNSSPLLVLDTDDLDIVNDLVARTHAVSRIRSSLRSASYQPKLPQLGLAGEHQGPRMSLSPHALASATAVEPAPPAHPGSRDPFFAFMGLSQGVGRVGESLRECWIESDRLLAELGNRIEADEQALAISRAHLEPALRESISQLLRIAAIAGIDLSPQQPSPAQAIDTRRD